MILRDALLVVRRLLAWITFVLLLVSALLVSISQLVLTGLDGYAQAALDEISQSSGTGISATKLKGDWRGLNPIIIVDDLTLKETEADAENHIGYLQVELDLLASLMNWRLVLSDLVVSDVTTRLQLLDDNRVKIAGFPLRESSGKANLLLDILTHAERIQVSGIVAELTSRFGRIGFRQSGDKPIQFLAGDDARRVNLAVNLLSQADKDTDEQAGELEILGTVSGDPRDLQQFSADLYIKLSDVQIQDPMQHGKVVLEEALVGFEAWVEFDQGIADVKIRLEVPELNFRVPGVNASAIRDTSALLRIRGSSLQDWQLVVNDLGFRHGEKRWALDNLFAASAVDGDDQNIVAYVADVDVGLSYSMLAEVAPGIIPEVNLSILNTINPAGVADEIFARVRLSEDEPVLSGVASLKGGSLDAYKGSPAIRDLEAVLGFAGKEGWIDIHNQAFKIKFATISDEFWEFDQGGGRLKFEFYSGFLKMQSELLQIYTKGMLVSGKFGLVLPKDETRQTWGLVLGIVNGDLSEKSQYLPNTLAASLRDWLNDSIESGTLIDGGLVFHGSLHQSAPAINKSYEMFFNVKDATLRYHQDWLRLMSLNGKVNVGNWGLEGRQVSATTEQVKIKGDVSAPFEGNGKTSWLTLTADFSGDAGDGLSFMNKTPISQMTNALTSEWLAQGPMQGNVDLQIPINYELTDEGVPLYQVMGDVFVSLAGVDVHLTEVDLDVADLYTTLHYNVERGLSSPEFNSRIFGYPVKGDVRTDLSLLQTGVNDQIVISADGTMDVSALRDWSKVTLLYAADGEFAYNAQVVTPLGENAPESYIQAKTDLVGVTLSVPEPIGKSADQSRLFHYRSTLNSSDMQVSMKYADLLRSELRVHNGFVERGYITLGNRTGRMPDNSGVVVEAEMTRLNFDEWWQWEENIASLYNAQADAALDEDLARIVSSLNIDVEHLDVMDMVFDSINVDVERLSDIWHIRVENPEVKGNIFVPDDATLPLKFDLDYLSLSLQDGSTNDGDPLAEMSVRDWQAIDFKTDQLKLNDDDLGSWSFDLYPVSDGLRIDNIQASVRGLSIDSEEGQNAHVDWFIEGDKQRTELHGRITSKDLESAAVSWGIAPSIRGDSFIFDADLSWDGSMAMISAEKLRGTVKFESKKGQFVQASSGGAMRLLGIFDFSSIARRLKFDFSDVVAKGYEFDSLEGELWFEDGLVRVVDAITIDGTSSGFKIGGELDLPTGELDGDMIVTLPVNRNLPWYAVYSAIFTGPLTGAGVYLAQKMLKNQINLFSSAKYAVSGTVDEPVVELLSIFDDSIREGVKLPQTAGSGSGSESEAMP